jgi:hypothetical protein
MLLAPPALATTITLQQGVNGYTGCTDAWLDESLPRYNYGGSATLHCQWNNGRSDAVVLKFDLAGKIPPSNVVTSATLSLWYVDCGGLANDNAVTLAPFRLRDVAGWSENGYDGVSGYGVSYAYRDAGESSPWTGGAEGGWYDKIDDASGTNKIKKAGGTPVDAIPPQDWVSFDVTASVQQWNSGAVNNGFLIDATGWQGSGAIGYGIFSSRNDSVGWSHPVLSISYDRPVATAKASWGRIKSLYR